MVQNNQYDGRKKRLCKTYLIISDVYEIAKRIEIVPIGRTLNKTSFTWSNLYKIHTACLGDEREVNADSAFEGPETASIATPLKWSSKHSLFPALSTTRLGWVSASSINAGLDIWKTDDKPLLDSVHFLGRSCTPPSMRPYDYELDFGKRSAGFHHQIDWIFTYWRAPVPIIHARLKKDRENEVFQC